MTGPDLGQLLRELGDEQPPLHLDPATYTRGRALHRRRLLVRVGTVAGVLALVAGVVAVAPRLQHGAPPVAGSRSAPALPTRLEPVPARLAESHEDGPRWATPVAAPDLAVGTTAAVLEVGRLLMAVSAIDGGYRGLDVDGFAGWDVSGRFDNRAFALSPDGERLAFSWSPGLDRAETLAPDAAVDSGVAVVDLVTGQVDRTVVPAPLSVITHGFGWSADGRYLAYAVTRITAWEGLHSRGAAQSVERLDTTTGTRLSTRGLLPESADLAVSDTGEVAVTTLGGVRTWLPGRAASHRPVDASVGSGWSSALFSPDARLVAASTVEGYVGVAPNAATPRHPPYGGTWDLAASGGDPTAVRLMGWSPGGLLIGTSTSRWAVLTANARDHLSGRTSPRTLIDLGAFDHVGLEPSALSVATSLADSPSRSFSSPDWPTDWGRVLTGLLYASPVLLLAGLWLRSGPTRRRPRRRP